MMVLITFDGPDPNGVYLVKDEAHAGRVSDHAFKTRAADSTGTFSFQDPGTKTVLRRHCMRVHRESDHA